jgi:CBS domain-containing protein
MTLVRDIMTPDPFTLSPTATLEEAMHLLFRRRLSGAPVVDGSELVGIISEIGMFDVLFDARLRQAPVADFMTRDVRTVDVSDGLGHLAHMFALYGIRRIPVMEDGRMVGIVSRRDLLAHALASGQEVEDPASRWSLMVEEPLPGA